MPMSTLPRVYDGGRRMALPVASLKRRRAALGRLSRRPTARHDAGHRPAARHVPPPLFPTRFVSAALSETWPVSAAVHLTSFVLEEKKNKTTHSVRRTVAHLPAAGWLRRVAVLHVICIRGPATCWLSCIPKG